MLHRTTQQVFSVVAGMKIAATNPDATTPRRSDVDFNVQTIKCVIQGSHYRDAHFGFCVSCITHRTFSPIVLIDRLWL